MDLTVNQAGFALRRFESYPLQVCRQTTDLQPQILVMNPREAKENDALAQRSEHCEFTGMV